MPTDAITASLLRQLATYRATLQTLLAQRASLGMIHAPPGMHADIAQARAAIAQLKADLRARGVAVDDEPGDVAGPDETIASAAGAGWGQRNHEQTISGGTVGVAIAGYVYGGIHLPPAPAPDPLAVAQVLLSAMP